MRWVSPLCISLVVLMAPLSLSTAEIQHPQAGRSGTGNGAGYSTHDASVLSMMGWGFGLGVGIAILCGMLEQETSSSHSH